MEQATDRRIFWRRWAAIGLLAAGLGGYDSLSAWGDAHGLLINTSESLPYWAFFVEKNAHPKRGDFVVFDPPKTELVVGHFGARPAAFAKIVYGVGGDEVVRREGRVFVHGREVAKLKPRTRKGEALAAGPTGIVPAGCFYVGSPHPDGFDSRYADIGFVCGRQVAGTGVPIL
ncbi:MAG: type VI secretion protein [Sphingomonadaceae bacterium]|nr:type VI secretion protein [Sphingomonadaceae bacterium]